MYFSGQKKFPFSDIYGKVKDHFMYSDSDDRRIKPRLMDGCRVSDHMVKLKVSPVWDGLS